MLQYDFLHPYSNSNMVYSFFTGRYATLQCNNVHKYM